MKLTYFLGAVVIFVAGFATAWFFLRGVTTVTTKNTDAAVWIADFYRVHQEGLISGTARKWAFEEWRFVPLTYAEEVAGCVEQVLDDSPESLGRFRFNGKNVAVGTDWRTRLPLISSLEHGNTRELTEKQMERATELREAILDMTQECRKQMVPSGAYEDGWNEFRSLLVGDSHKPD